MKNCRDKKIRGKSTEYNTQILKREREELVTTFSDK